MKEDKFIKEYSEIWSKLETTLKKLKSKGFTKFANKELDEFISLYNSTCGHLSYSRTNYSNSNTTSYLNRLVASAHAYIYTKKTSNFKVFLNFFFIKFPFLIRKNIIFLLITMAIFFTGFLYSFVTTMISEENATAFVPESVISKVISDNSGKAVIAASQGPATSSEIFTNNIKVGIMSFVLGVTIVGTVWMMLFSSTSMWIGCVAALALNHGTGSGFWSLILPHGVFEMFSIFVCGAAGLMIGFSFLVPGKYSRKDSLILKGREAIRLLLGAAIILVVAGIIEGFFTPMDINPYIKIYFALFTFLLLLFYLIFPNLYFSKKLKEPLKID